MNKRSHKNFIAHLALFLSLSINSAFAYIIGVDVSHATIRPSMPTIAQEGNWRYGFIFGDETLNDYDLFKLKTYLNLSAGPRYSGTNGFREKMFNISINTDLIYDFIENDTNKFGFFVGLGVGYTQNTFSTNSLQKTEVNGFDLGLNAGLRAKFQEAALELWTQTGLIDPSVSFAGIDYKIKRSYSLGLRCILYLPGH